MKKIVSIIIAVLMVASMTVTSFAASATFSTNAVEVGTATATADLTLSFDGTVNVGMMQINLVLPDGITLTNVDFSSFSSLCGSALNDNNIEIGQLLVYDDDQDVEVTGDLPFTYTFTIADPSVAANYEMEIDPVNTMIMAPDGSLLIEEFDGLTIEVKEAKKDPETVEGAKVTSEVSEVTIDGAVYTNVAIFKATLGTANGNYSEAGFIWVKDDNKTDNKYTVDASVISGGGEVTYTAAMFAIADGVKIEAIPYYVTAE